MPISLFHDYQPIDRYNRADLARQFGDLAQLTGGECNPVALDWNWSGSNIIVGDIYRRGFLANLWIEHDWTVHTNLVVTLPSGIVWELRFNNVYGDASGVPIVGKPRVESDLHDRAVAALLPEHAYWSLTLARQPFALTVSKARLSLATYRFYPCAFYLGALDYLTEMAERVETLTRAPLPVRNSIVPVSLPWLE
jgi:hypothetical protein